MNTLHELKTEAPYFAMICDGEKTFELRKNDRNFKHTDFLLLREIKSAEPLEYTGRQAVCEIRTTLEGYPGMVEGYILMGIRVIAAKLNREDV